MVPVVNDIALAGETAERPSRGTGQEREKARNGVTGHVAKVVTQGKDGACC
jgi:hypothetical protein